MCRDYCFLLYIVRHVDRTGYLKTHCSFSGLWVRNISEMLVQREGCGKKEVGYNSIAMVLQWKSFLIKRLTLPGQRRISWVARMTLHCYSLHVFLSGSVLVLIIVGYGAASLTDLFPKSWNNIVVSSSRVDVSTKKNKKWKSWTLRRLHTRPLRYLARSDTFLWHRFWTVQFRICAIRKFDSGSTYGYHSLCRCMEPHCSGGPKTLCVYQLWCQIYFLRKFVHCTVCIVSSGLRVKNTTKISFALD